MKLTGTDGQTGGQNHVLSKADTLTENSLGKLLDKLVAKRKESKAIERKFVCILLWNNVLIFHKYLCYVYFTYFIDVLSYLLRDVITHSEYKMKSTTCCLISTMTHVRAGNKGSSLLSLLYP